MKNIWWLAGLVFLVSGCGTSPVLSPSSSETITRNSKSHPRNQELESDSGVDPQALQSSLGLARDLDDLGFREKSFNTCEVGHGYSRDKDCRLQNFVVIHFRLQCRDSEGTVSRALSSVDLTPIAGRDIKWSLMGQQGLARTDSEGYGQIRAAFSGSPKKERLKLATLGNFLYIRAGEIDQVVAPKSWCPL